MHDLRSYLASLENSMPDHIRRVKEPVSHEYAITAMVEEAAKTHENPALLFENVEGFKQPVLVNVFGHVDRVKLALEGASRPMATRVDLYGEWSELMAKEIEPEFVGYGSTKQVKFFGGDVDLMSLPVLKFYEQDAGRYLTSGLLVARDPDMPEKVNLSFARMQLKGRARIGTSLHSRGNMWSYFEKSKARGEPLDVAVVIGAHPSIYLAAAAKITGEYETAGAMAGEPVQLVKCETVDIPVPADAEIVLEGRITLSEEDEGPFTEYTGYLSGRSTRNRLEISCVTMRNDAIYQTIMPSNSDEHLLLSGLPKQARIYGAVRAFTPMPAVRDIAWPVSGTHYLCLISMLGDARRVPGLGKHLGLLIMGLDPYVKMAVVLPEDVDVSDLGAALSAIAQRCDGRFGSGVEVLHEVFCHRLDPSSSPEGTSSKVLIDATAQPRMVELDPDLAERPTSLGIAEAGHPMGTVGVTVLKMRASWDPKSALRALEVPGLTVCVDDDIDVLDVRQVVWGMMTRFQPGEDLILSDGHIGIDGTKPEGWKAEKATLPRS